MNIKARFASQLINLKQFGSFFPASQVVRDIFLLPWDIFKSSGSSRKWPSILNINLTTRCNLKCEVCFAADNSVPKEKELSLEEIKSLIDQAAPYRTGIFFSGGEPLIRGDIVEMVSAARARNLACGLVTNGCMITESVARDLVRAGINHILISFFGEPENHDQIVSVKGSFERGFAGLKILATVMKPPGPMVNYIVTPKGISDLPAFRQRLSQVGNCVLRISHLNFLTRVEVEAQKRYWQLHMGDAPLEIHSYVLAPLPETMSHVIDSLLDTQGKGILTKPILNDEEVRLWYADRFVPDRRCIFIWRSAFLNSDGTVYPCQFLYSPMGNIREKSMEEIWNGERYRRFRRLLRNGLMPGCSRCCKL